MSKTSNSGCARVHAGRLFLALSLLVVVIAGCTQQKPGSTSGSPASPDESKDPCSLVTKEEAEGLVGGPLEAKRVSGTSERFGGLHYVQCVYEGEQGQQGNFVSAGVYVDESAAQDPGEGLVPREFSRDEFEALIQAAISAGDPMQPVEGIGDSAYWFNSAADPNNVLRALYFLKGTTFASVAAINQGEDEQATLAATTSLATTVLPRIP